MRDRVTRAGLHPVNERHLDLIGLRCPLPALKAEQALGRMAAGDVLVVACTDPLARIDIPHLVRRTGHHLEAEELRGDAVLFRIRVREAAGGDGAVTPAVGSGG